MSRVLVVSRNAAMAMGLSATDYEVIDLRPQAFGDWIECADDADALILELENPQLAAAAVGNLRAHGKQGRVLLVSSDRPGWDDPGMRDLPGTEVLPLPISRPVLLSALKDLLSDARRPEPPQVETPTSEEDRFLPDDTGDDWRSEEFHTAEALDELVHTLDHVAVEAELELIVEDQLDSVILAPKAASIDIPQPSSPLSLEATTAASHQWPAFVTPGAEQEMEPASPAAPAEAEQEAVAESEAEPGSVDSAANKDAEPAAQPPLSAVPRTRRSTTIPTAAASHVLDDLDRLRATPAREDSTRKRAATSARRPRRERADTATTRSRGQSPTPKAKREVSPAFTEPIQLVRALAGQVGSLYGVPETAEVVIADAVDRAHADAGALMVPDHGAWRVAAGVGLRPLEYRYELLSSSWLIEDIARGHKGAIIQESDIARERLHGAPLASWRHLLAAPVPQVGALLILARREDPPFTEDQLATLAEVGAEAAGLLQAAIDTRSLARQLWQFRDDTDLPR